MIVGYASSWLDPTWTKEETLKWSTFQTLAYSFQIVNYSTMSTLPSPQATATGLSGPTGQVNLPSWKSWPAISRQLPGMSPWIPMSAWQSSARTTMVSKTSLSSRPWWWVTRNSMTLWKKKTPSTLRKTSATKTVSAPANWKLPLLKWAVGKPKPKLATCYKA